MQCVHYQGVCARAGPLALLASPCTFRWVERRPDRVRLSALALWVELHVGWVGVGVLVLLAPSPFHGRIEL